MTRAKRQQERAVVLAQKNQVARAPRRKEAIKEIRRLFDEKNYEGVARALLPDVVVDKSFEVTTDNYNSHAPLVPCCALHIKCLLNVVCGPVVEHLGHLLDLPAAAGGAGAGAHQQRLPPPRRVFPDRGGRGGRRLPGGDPQDLGVQRDRAPAESHR